MEITTNARTTADGRPVLLDTGVHHAREWPSFEHAKAWSHEPLTGSPRRPGPSRAYDRGVRLKLR